MTRSVFYTIFFFSFICCSLTDSYAQNKVIIKTAVDRNKILIGEQFHLRVEAKFPAKQPFSPLNIDSIPHFEILDAGIAAESLQGEEKIIKQEILLTSFDSGHWVIPSFRIGKNFLTDTIHIDVVFSDFDPNQDYHDVRDIIPVDAESKDNWWWYAIGGGLLLLLLLLIWLLRKKKPVDAKTSPDIDPYKEAIQQLELLQKSNLPPKQYYSALVEIFRLYVFRRKGILSQQKTTDDLIVQLKGINLDQEQLSRLSQALRLSDFVKFAKYIPAEEDTKTVFETIKTSVELIEQKN